MKFVLKISCTTPIPRDLSSFKSCLHIESTKNIISTLPQTLCTLRSIPVVNKKGSYLCTCYIRSSFVATILKSSALFVFPDHRFRPSLPMTIHWKKNLFLFHQASLINHKSFQIVPLPITTFPKWIFTFQEKSQSVYFSHKSYKVCSMPPVPTISCFFCSFWL